MGRAFDRAIALWRDEGCGPVLVLTGAGISAESGIPTFRGSDGYWTVGSRNYRPMELATLAAFCAMPLEVWRFYLQRIRRHADAVPNAAHLALADLEALLGDRFTLITQNVDGLHLRAGSSEARTWRIHGDLRFVRCADACGFGVAPLPHLPGRLHLDDRSHDEALRELLRCPSCAGWLRPHVLWFDECYDEEHFRFESSLRAARSASLLLVVGTSGATNLPDRIVRTVHARQRPILVVDPEGGAFADLAAEVTGGAHFRATATRGVCEVVDALRAVATLRRP